MNNIIYINEDNRRKDEDAWQKNFDKDIQQADISIAYSNFLEEERKNAIIELANNLPKKKIVIYEQAMDIGGFWIPPINLMDILTYSTVICVGISFNEFFKELGKDVYKATLGKLFANKEEKEINDSGIAIEFCYNKKIFKYILSNYLSSEEKFEALQKIQENIIHIDKESSIEFMRFIYDRHNKKWWLM